MLQIRRRYDTTSALTLFATSLDPQSMWCDYSVWLDSNYSPEQAKGIHDLDLTSKIGAKNQKRCDSGAKTGSANKRATSSIGSDEAEKRYCDLQEKTGEKGFGRKFKKRGGKGATLAKRIESIVSQKR